MSRPRLQESIQERRLWAIDMTGYDRSPLLTEPEQERLKQLLAQCVLKADFVSLNQPNDETDVLMSVIGCYARVRNPLTQLVPAFQIIRGIIL